MSIKRSLIKLHWLLSSQFGIDPQRFQRSLRGVPRFLSDWWTFRKGHIAPLVWMPCLHDRYAEGGTTKSEYFWQDLLVARWIHAAAPSKHVDIGSRVDGFVAHVASFRDVEVFDVRPVTTLIPGVVFTRADMMDAASIAPLIAGGGYCDSLSCLHALEHFGLGRYGDPIDPNGYKKGLTSMAKLLQPGGTLYLSTPIGHERVEFNANWVFDPRTIIAAAQEWGLTLRGLTVVSPEKGPQETATDQSTLRVLAEQPYHLGIFTFTKAKSL
jgi:hypothetical protein